MHVCAGKRLVSAVLASCSLCAWSLPVYQEQLTRGSCDPPVSAGIVGLYVCAWDWTQIPVFARQPLHKLSHPLSSNFLSFWVDFFHHDSLFRATCFFLSYQHFPLPLGGWIRLCVCCSLQIFIMVALSPRSRELTKDKVSISSNIPTLLCCQVIKQGKLLSHTGC